MLSAAAEETKCRWVHAMLSRQLVYGAVWDWTKEPADSCRLRICVQLLRV